MNKTFQCRLPCPQVLEVIAALCCFAGLITPVSAQLPPAGYALAFNGTNQSGFTSLLSTATDDFTLEVWVNPAIASGNHCIAYNGDSSSNGWGLYQIGNQFQAIFGGLEFFGSGTVRTGAWTHLALTRGSGVAAFYVDGIPSATTLTAPNPPTSVFSIGVAPTAAVEYFAGQIDELRVWSMGLTYLQVAYYRRHSPAAGTPGLLDCFHFDDGAGFVATNSQNAAYVSLQNMPSWVPSGVPFGPATDHVISLADDGTPGTLRNVIASSLPGDNIVFDVNGLLGVGSPLGIGWNLSLTGPGATNLILSGVDVTRVLYISNSATVNLSGLTIRNGKAADGGPGSTETPGTAGSDGGAIYNLGVLSLSNCFLTLNHAGNGGPGAAGTSGNNAPTDGGPGGNGGAIYNGGFLSIAGCSFSSNFAGNGATGGSGGAGAGFHAGRGGNGGFGGAIWSAGPLSVVNCTFGTNFAGAGAAGGGVGADFGQTSLGGDGGDGGNGGAIYSSVSAGFISCTIVGNFAGNGAAGGTGASSDGGKGGNGGSGGGIYVAAGATGFRNCLVAQNGAGSRGAAGPGSRGATSGVAGSGPDVFGTVTSQFYNLIGQSAGSAGFRVGQPGDLLGYPGTPLDPQVGPLQQNGGPTPTYALLATSPALDAGDDTLGGSDQRGFPRWAGGHTDIGSVELGISGYPLPSISAGNVGAVVVHSDTHLADCVAFANVNQGGLPATVYLQFSPTTAYGSQTASVSLAAGNSSLPISLPLTGLAPGLIWHLRMVIQTDAGFAASSDLTLETAAFFPPGDLNGDGVVDQGELNLVLSNYWLHSPWLAMTNTIGLGTTNVQFSLTNASAWLFSVQVSTNLVGWSTLGSAAPVYQFADPAATNAPQRYYRLRWP